MKFDIYNRWTGDVQFTAEIDCAEDAPQGVKIGLAVRWAVEHRASLNHTSLYRASLNGANLNHANLNHANLNHANLYHASLYRANLNRANLDGASLYRANLDGASLYRASLYRASLYRASLNHANLDGASLNHASLYRANLNHASLYRASLDGASLDGASLDGANGNSREIISLQTDIWPVTYTAKRMQIGCENHALPDWWDFDDKRINSMDCRALEWWRKWKPILRQIIEINPARPTGHEAPE